MSDASFRLAGGIRPNEYTIHLELNLPAWTFRGRETIELQLDESTSAIELHALGLDVESATLSWGGREHQLAIAAHPEWQTVALTVDEPVPAGEATLQLSFRGTIAKDLRGLYRAQVGEERYAFTQCEPTEARRIFACFDEPAFKARFTLSVQAPEDLAVISNEPIASEAPGPQRGTRVVTFHTTPKMSTYLVALAVGKLEASPTTSTSSGVPIRVWTVPGKTGLAAFPAEAAAASVERLEAYFGIRYPYRKLDLLAIPDFEAGAMENSGAVFFRERRLLCDRDKTPLETLKSIALVIAHELAHQWFGNLVTMRWWDDLWLNEAFATWMEYVIIDDWQPDWNVWIGFQQAKASPFHTDSLVSTRAIRARVASAEQASEMFDAITYEKGAAVLRMLEQYLSPAVFRDGVRQYLQDHLESNASADDLFDALADASSQPIREVATDWIDQPGYPLVTARLLAGTSERRGVELGQRRFFLHPERSAAPASPERWHVPVVLKYQADGATHEQRLLLEREPQETELEAAGVVEWLTANAGENGFYRVAYDQALFEGLVTHLPRALGPTERIGFLGNQWALVRAGHASAGAFLDLLTRFENEPARAVVEVVVGRLSFYRQFLVDPADRPTFRHLVGRLFRPALQKLGWSPGPGEDDETRLLRAAVITALGSVARAEDVVAEARRQLERQWSQPGSVDANLLDALVAISAASGDRDLFEAYLERAQHAPTPDEQFRYLLGLGAFEGPDLVARALDLTVTPAIQTQDVGLLLGRLLANPEANQAAWRFIQERWPVLSPRLPPLMVRRVIQATVTLGTSQARREVEAFFRGHPVKEAERTLQQTLEELDLLVAFRQRAQPLVQEYLRSPAG